MANLDVSPQSDPPATFVNVPGLLRLSLFIGGFIREILYGEDSPQPKKNLVHSHLTKHEAGVELVTFLAAVYCICHRPSDYRKRQRFYVVCGGILIVLATISVTADALLAKYTWIDASERYYPGGQLESHEPSESDWYNILGFSADATANILGDGLLVRHIFP